jgi:RNA polymerase sigma-70 factor (ECF subfamily)
VFLEVWRHRDRGVTVDDSVLPWLFGIAANVCRNATRSQRRLFAATARLTVPPDEPDHADGVAARLDAERRMAPVLRALRTLNSRDQDVLTLVDWSGLSYPEAAVALGIPVGTVRSRLARARERLTRTLDRTDTAVDRIDTDPQPPDSGDRSARHPHPPPRN